MSKWADPINRIIKIMLDLADLADEKKETPFGDELGGSPPHVRGKASWNG